jgi:hypothetical protein
MYSYEYCRQETRAFTGELYTVLKCTSLVQQAQMYKQRSNQLHAHKLFRS